MKKYLLLLAAASTLSASAQFNSQDIITDTPTGGTYMNVNRSGRGFFRSSFSGQEFGQFTCTLGDLVATSDGHIYMKNPLSQRKTGSYIRLDKESDGRYVAHLPQAISTEDGQTTYAMRMVLRTQGDLFTYVPDTLADKSIKTDVWFTFRNDSLIQDSEGRGVRKLPKVILGECNNKGIWKGFGDDEVVYSVIKDEVISPQPTTTTENYQLEYRTEDNEMRHVPAKVAIEGSKFFIQLPYYDKRWIHGIFDGTKVVFASHYMGRNEKENCHQYLVPCSYVGKSFRVAEKLTLNYDTDTKELTCEKGYALVINAGDQFVIDRNRLAVYKQPVLSPFVEQPATPKAPEIISVHKDDSGYGLGSTIGFKIKAEDTEGYYISTEKLYYRLYLDDSNKPYKFYIDGNKVSDILSTYTDGTTFFIQNDVNYIITDLGDEFTKVGIQEVYKGGGEVHTSDITWYNLSPDGINSVNADTSVQSVEYYTLSGVRIAHPFGGLFIRRTTYADGTVTSVKIAR